MSIWNNCALVTREIWNSRSGRELLNKQDWRCFSETSLISTLAYGDFVIFCQPPNFLLLHVSHKKNGCKNGIFPIWKLVNTLAKKTVKKFAKMHRNYSSWKSFIAHSEIQSTLLKIPFVTFCLNSDKSLFSLVLKIEEPFVQFVKRDVSKKGRAICKKTDLNLVLQESWI